uniref:hypothetical protein n=1 Tax=Trinickia diaoshuihuensis TaxID=2292265 RepID=UPI003B82DD07
MRDQTAREAKFPVACARCGGRISEPVAFCPHCGAHARFALAGTASPIEPTQRAESVRSEPRARSAAVQGRFGAPADDFEGDLDPPWPGRPTPLFASPDGDPYGGLRAPAFRGSRQWGFKGGTALVVAGFIVLYGGAVAIHRYDGAAPLPQPSASKSVEGVIAPSGADESNAALPVTNGTNGTGAANAPNVADSARPAPPPTPAAAAPAP